MPGSSMLNSMLKQCTGFDKVVRNVKFLTAANGNCTASYTVSKDDTNHLGGLHGGCSATLVDVISSLGLMTHSTWNKASVSVNINLNYCKGGQTGNNLLISSNVLKAGKKVAFLDCEIRNADDNSLLVKAEHTKFILH